MLGLDENGELTYYYKDEEKTYVSLLENLVNLLQQKDKEIERLNNNWNKLEEWLNIQQNISSSEQILNDIFNKIQELKGSDRE